MAQHHSPSPLDDISPSFEDDADFRDADRGFIASLSPCVIKNARGNIIWNNDEFNFVNEQSCPTTVNAKLWRQAQLLSKQGLYRLSSSIYQVRGFDISHITFVEGKTGIIIIDPLVSCECAAAALKLYQTQRGVRPVKAVIYTHSHIDHFGGAAGVLQNQNVTIGDIPIIAPEHFMEEATSENVFAGPIMRYRAAHMYGSRLPRSPVGQVGVGLGMGTSHGTTSLIPPTINIKHTGQELNIDQVRLIFQMVPNTEAPAELNIYFPDEKSLLVAECATHSLHNIVTLRGALVRDAKAWSRYLDETLTLYCEAAGAEVLFGSHGWPTWSSGRIKCFLEDQRDMYAYIHDQTVRKMNQGYNGTEIAEQLIMPPRLRRAWHAQGFYGSVSHNVKGIYQRYMTWYDGKAENLWKWPPKEEGARYVACIGGAEEVLKKAKEFMDQGDLRFAATLLSHVVATEDEAEGAQSQCREMLALVFERLGFGAENATWRNYYLSQSLELKKVKRVKDKNSSGMAMFGPTLSVEQWLAALSIMIDGEAAGKEEQNIYVNIHVKDTSETCILILSSGALSYRFQASKQSSGGHSGVSLEKNELCQVLNGKSMRKNPAVQGDTQAFDKVLSFASIGNARKEGTSHL